MFGHLLKSFEHHHFLTFIFLMNNHCYEFPPLVIKSGPRYCRTKHRKQCVFFIRRPCELRNSQTMPSHPMPFSPIRGDQKRLPSMTCKANAPQLTSMASRRCRAAVPKPSKMVIDIFGSTLAASIKPVALSYRRLSIRCSSGIGAQEFATHTWPTCQMTRIHGLVIRRSGEAGGLLVVGLSKN
jgi:hypothetical protein